jgi:hypothetical protein
MSVEVRDIKINGIVIPRPSSFTPRIERYYTADIERNKKGQILSFPRKFYVPKFEATWTRMTIEEYSQLKSLCYTVDTINIEWWNPLTLQYETREFAIESLTEDRLIDKDGDFMEWENIKMSAVQTNNMVIPAQIIFNANGGTGTMANKNGYIRDEYSVPASTFTPPSGKVFINWNTSADGTGSAFEVGQQRTYLYESLTLYAQWSS